jgi:hypothetical protein
VPRLCSTADDDEPDRVTVRGDAKGSTEDASVTPNQTAVWRRSL